MPERTLYAVIECHEVYADGTVILREEYADGSFGIIDTIPHASRVEGMAFALAQTACDNECIDELLIALQHFMPSGTLTVA